MSSQRTSTSKGGPGKRTPHLSKARLDALVEEATVVEVTVEKVEMTEAEEIVAVCKRGRERQRISILDLPLPSAPPQGAEWIAAYPYWREGFR